MDNNVPYQEFNRTIKEKMRHAKRELMSLQRVSPERLDTLEESRFWKRIDRAVKELMECEIEIEIYEHNINQGRIENG